MGRTAAKLHPDPVRKGSEADQHHEHTDNYSEHGDGPQDHVHNQADYQLDRRLLPSDLANLKAV